MSKHPTCFEKMFIEKNMMKMYPYSNRQSNPMHPVNRKAKETT